MATLNLQFLTRNLLPFLRKYVNPLKLLVFILSILQKYNFNLNDAHDKQVQIPSCFPNNNSKPIDYVIVYRKEQVMDDDEENEDEKEKTAKEKEKVKKKSDETSTQKEAEKEKTVKTAKDENNQNDKPAKDEKKDADKKKPDGDGKENEKEDEDEDEKKNNNEKLTKKEYKAKKKARKTFLKKLIEEGFEYERLSLTTDKEKEESEVFILLHCKSNRLFKEAEKTKLQMRLDNELFDYDDSEFFEIKWIRFAKSFLFRRKALKKDENGNIVTAPFEASVQDIFIGCDEESLEKNPSGPFSTADRFFLVDSILKEISIEDVELDKNKQNMSENVKKLSKSDSQNKKGLEYFLGEKIFHDAFILHAPSNHYPSIYDMLQSARQHRQNNSGTGSDSSNTSYIPSDEYLLKPLSLASDERFELYEKWAKLKNFFKSQPLDLIRTYFGDVFGFYFAWTGALIFMLFIPSIAGIAFFLYGIIKSSKSVFGVSINVALNESAFEQLSVLQNYYLDVFSKAFNNDATPYFAFIMCIWGVCFSEFWNRENKRLAYEWDVSQVEEFEPDLPEYTQRMKSLKKQIAQSSDFKRAFLNNQRRIKSIVGFVVLLISIVLITLNTSALALYRIHIKNVVFVNNTVGQFIIGDVGSGIMTSISMTILNTGYTKFAFKFNDWKNYRTQTEKDDALIYQLFIFEFFNNYGPLYYIALFRQIKSVRDFLSLGGGEYQEKCDGDNCMVLLTTQVIMILAFKRLPGFFLDVFKTLKAFLERKKTINDAISAQSKLAKLNKKKRKSKETSPKEDEKEKAKNQQRELKLKNRCIVLNYVSVERGKEPSGEIVKAEYSEKVILYGYLLMFSCAFPLGPIVLLITSMIDTRMDALKLLWLNRRPVPQRAQDVGAWAEIIRFLNLAGIITNAFIIAFTSSWAHTMLEDKLENRLLFIVVFEHVICLIWLGLTRVLDSTPSDVKFKTRIETQIARQTIDAFREVKLEIYNDELEKMAESNDNESKRRENNDCSKTIEINGKHTNQQLSRPNSSKQSLNKETQTNTPEEAPRTVTPRRRGLPDFIASQEWSTDDNLFQQTANTDPSTSKREKFYTVNETSSRPRSINNIQVDTYKRDHDQAQRASSSEMNSSTPTQVYYKNNRNNLHQDSSPRDRNKQIKPESDQDSLLVGTYRRRAVPDFLRNQMGSDESDDYDVKIARSSRRGPIYKINETNIPSRQQQRSRIGRHLDHDDYDDDDDNDDIYFWKRKDDDNDDDSDYTNRSSMRRRGKSAPSKVRQRRKMSSTKILPIYGDR